MFVYCETIKRELNRRLIYECRCDERRKAKAEGFTRLTLSGLYGGLEQLKIHKKRENRSFPRFALTPSPQLHNCLLHEHGLLSLFLGVRKKLFAARVHCVDERWMLQGFLFRSLCAVTRILAPSPCTPAAS
jgi:hypothetical protein